MKKLFSFFAMFFCSVMMFAGTIEVVPTEALPWEGNGVKLVADKGSGSTNPAFNTNGADVRIYANGTLTVTSESVMTQIVFTVSAQGKKRLAPLTVSAGTVAELTAAPDYVTWTGEATEVVFTVGAKAEYGSEGSTKAGQFCWTKAVITTDDSAVVVVPTEDAEPYQFANITEADFKNLVNGELGKYKMDGDSTVSVNYTATDKSVMTFDLRGVSFSYSSSSTKNNIIKTGSTFVQTDGKGVSMTISGVNVNDTIVLNVCAKGSTDASFEATGATGGMTVDKSAYIDMPFVATDSVVTIKEIGGGFRMTKIGFNPYVEPQPIVPVDTTVISDGVVFDFTRLVSDSDYVVLNATKNTNSTERQALYDLAAGDTMAIYRPATANVILSYSNKSDRTNAMSVYLAGNSGFNGIQFGGAGGMIILQNVVSGTPIIVHAAAKGTTAGLLVALTGATGDAVTMPAKDINNADADANGYVWVDATFTATASTVVLQETSGGIRLSTVQATVSEILNLSGAADAYNIIVTETENGTVKTEMTVAEAGQEVSLVITPDEGYEIDELIVRDINNNAIDVTADYTFVMPATNVVVVVTFKASVVTPDPVADFTQPFTLVFKESGTSSDNNSSYKTSTALTDIFESGAEYLESIVSIDKVYAGRTGRGSKLGNTSNPGTMSVEMKQKIAVEKFVVSASGYNSTEGSSISINGLDTITLTTVGDEFSDYTFVANGEEISTISLSSVQKRAYIKSITVYPYVENVDTIVVGEEYLINVVQATGGVVVADADSAAAGTLITLTIRSEENYELDNISVVDANGNGVELSANNTFLMPAAAVTVTAVFKVATIDIQTISVAEALALIDTLASGQSTDAVYHIYGEIAGDKLNTDANMLQYGNLRINIKDPQTGDELLCYYIYNLGKEKFTSVDQVPEKGASVIVEGKLTKYGTTPEITNCYFYSITHLEAKAITLVQPTVGGSISADKQEAKRYETVTLSYEESTGYGFVAWTVKTVSGQDVVVTGNSFEMPEDAVTVSAEFKQAEKYAITVAQVANGSAVADLTEAIAGATVTLTYSASMGYTFGSVEVKDAAGQDVAVSGNQFTMPASAVTVTATFVEIPTLTVAEFLNKKETDTNYKLVGVVSNIVSTTYGNFDLVDETGSIYIYGLLNLEGQARQFASMDIAEKDTVTLYGKYMSYNGKDEISNAQYLSHKKYVEPVYSVELVAPLAEEGTLAVSTTEAHAGDWVVITATNAREHYDMEVSVIDAEGESVVTSYDAEQKLGFVMPANNVKVSVAYTAHLYTVRFMNGNEELEVLSLPYGAEVKYSKDEPQEQGKRFNGWDKEITTVDGDKDYVAQFINVYSVTIVQVEGATITVNNNTESFEATDETETLTIAITMEEGYVLESLKATDDLGTAISVEYDELSGSWTGAFPKQNVTVTALVKKSTPTSIEDAMLSTMPVKVVENGNVYIIVDGVRYSVGGAMISK